MKTKTKTKTKTKKKRQTGWPIDAFPDEMLLQLQQMMGGADAVELDEVKAMLTQLGDPGALADDSDLDEETRGARFQAQELAFEAMEAPNARDAGKLARQALALDPECLDALATLAGVESKTADEAIEYLTRAVAAGEQRLGAAFFERNKGQFWSLIETRSYMRARQQLAEVLAIEERYAEAIGHNEALIALSEGDNLGVRYPLLGLYLAVKDLEGARRLFAAYDEMTLTFFAWGKVLERYLAEDLAGAAAAWKKARAINPHVERLLTGQTPLPKEMPETYQIFSKDEAVIFLHMFTGAIDENASSCSGW